MNTIFEGKKTKTLFLTKKNAIYTAWENETLENGSSYSSSSSSSSSSNSRSTTPFKTVPSFIFVLQFDIPTKKNSKKKREIRTVISLSAFQNFFLLYGHHELPDMKSREDQHPFDPEPLVQFVLEHKITKKGNTNYTNI